MSRSTRSKTSKYGLEEEGSQINVTLIDLIKLVYRVDKDAVFSRRTKATLKVTCKDLNSLVNSRVDKLLVDAGQLCHLVSSSLCRTCVELSIHGDMTVLAMCSLVAADLPMVEELDLCQAMLPPKLLTCLCVKLWPKVRRLSLYLNGSTAENLGTGESNFVPFPALEELKIHNPDYVTLRCFPIEAFVERLLLAKKSNIRKVDFRGVKLDSCILNDLMSLFHSNLEVFCFRMGRETTHSYAYLNFALLSLLNFPSQNLKELVFGDISAGNLKILASLPILKQIETLAIEIIKDDEAALLEFKALLNGLKGGCLKSFALEGPKDSFLEFPTADLPALESLSCSYRGNNDSPCATTAAVLKAKVPLLRHFKLSSPDVDASFPVSFASKDTFPLLEHLEIQCISLDEAFCQLLAPRVPSLRALELRAQVVEEDVQILFSQRDLQLKTLVVENAEDGALLELAGHAANMPLLEELGIRFDCDSILGLKGLITAGKLGAWPQLKILRCDSVPADAETHLCGPLHWPNLEILTVSGRGRVGASTKNAIRSVHGDISIKFTDSNSDIDNY